MTAKPSQSLTPDETKATDEKNPTLNKVTKKKEKEKTSILEAIKHTHYQYYYCSKVNEALTSDILLQNNGWIADNENEEVRPLWFPGRFLISS